ncbi:MAG: BMP family ABC transporter substrate-binding protein [Alphaproteobacteria bacterium]|nr:MAG: BMP family ABC transporter substrate-binding protein [Alphaproteobacteria bacterium]
MGIMAWGSCTALAASEPVLIYDLGGKFDKSFNEAAYNGAERYRIETGNSYKDFEPTNEAQMEQALKRFARKGAPLVLAIGIAYQTPLEKVAPEFPDVHFTAVDANINLPNVQSVSFREDEGSYLVGMIAAMKSETGSIGFIGGMDIPLIRKFGAGYLQGARSVNPDIKLLENFVGATPTAWNDPIRGGELARSQFARGVDVIYSAAGPTGLGVIQAAKEAKQFAIGVDSNQNHIAPGTVLTSMVKRVDVVVYENMLAASSGTWAPGNSVRGLAEGGVDYSVDEHNADLITDDMKARVEEAKQMIISGDIKVGE